MVSICSASFCSLPTSEANMQNFSVWLAIRRSFCFMYGTESFVPGGYTTAKNLMRNRMEIT